MSASCIGDVNGDGVDDVLLGAPYSRESTIKAAYVIYGRIGGSPDIYLSVFNHMLGFVIYGAVEEDALGSAGSGIGDINGDGVEDFVVSAPFAHSNRGAVYVIYGQTGYRENLFLLRLTASEGHVISGFSMNSQVGFAVAEVVM